MATRKLITCLVGVLLQAMPAAAETLSQAVDRALFAEPSIRSARASLLAAKSDYAATKALGGPNASLALSGGATRDHSTVMLDTQGIITASLSASQPIFDGGTGKAEMQRANSAAFAADARLVDSMNIVGLQTAQAYLEIMRLTNARAILNRSVATLRDIERRLKLRVRGGFGNAADAYEAEARVQAAKVQLADVAQQLRNAITDYSALVGSPPEHIEPVRSYGWALPNSLDDVVASARLHSPKILALQYDALSAAAAADSALAQSRPKLDLVFQVDRTAYPSTPLDDTSQVSALLSFHYNLYDGGAAKNRAEQASHVADATRYSAAAKSTEVEREIVESWDAIHGSGSKVMPLRLQNEAAKKSLAVNLQRFDAGYTTLEKIMDLQSQVTGTELAILNENVSRHYNTFRLLAATGQLVAVLKTDAPSKRISP